MRRALLVLAAVTLVSGVLASSAAATHSWGSYHWARQSNPFTIKVVNSMTSDWTPRLSVATSDWAQSAVLDIPTPLPVGDTSAKTRKRCPAISGQVRSCNAAYGFNGWLGLASISANSSSHITQGTAKMNDSYLASSSYTDTNKQHVICQEIGHDWGLDHQDESGADRNTCMDYSNALDNPHPNQHDYDQLVTIYSHLDSSTTIGMSAKPGAKPAKVDREDRIRDTTVTETFRDGSVRVTHILWAIPGQRP